jgi:predicted transcriptional regulator
MNVIAAVSTAQGDHTKMKHFTIDTENNITIHASRKAAHDTGAAVFSTEVQLADLIGPDNKRLLEIWNSLPGVKPVTKFANRKVATERIWKAIQGLGERPVAAPASEPQVGAIETETALAEVPAAEASPELAQIEPPLEDATPQTTSEPAGADLVEQPAEAAEPVATVSAQAPQGAPAEGESSKEATPPKNAPKAKRAAKAQETAGPREGSKKAQLVALLSRKNGATLNELAERFEWKTWTVRGFMAGSLKKAGYTVESFKSDKGERTYRINP